MELYQMKLFVDLANTGTFTKVAAENYVTQAAVTLQIRKLESELGVRLFHRTTRSVTLLEAGERLLPYAKEILARTDEAISAVRDTRNEVSGLVRVAAVHSVGLYELPAYIKEFITQYPGVNLRVDYRTADEIYRALHDGEVDLGLVAYPTDMPRIECLPFSNDQLAVVCPKDHPLAKQKKVKLEELEGQNFVQFSEDAPTRRATDSILADRGISVNIRMECDNIEVLKQMVESGYGITLLPRQSLRPVDIDAGLRSVELSDTKIERPIGILILKNSPRFKAIRAFIDILQGKESK